MRPAPRRPVFGVLGCPDQHGAPSQRVRRARWGFPTLPRSFRLLLSALARVMDKFDLSRKMKRLTAWLDTQNRPDGLAGRQFHGVPFADAYVTIDPERQSPYASANLNRAHLCGTEAGMSADSVQRLIGFFADHGVQRVFVWLSPGPDIDKARG